MFHHLIYTVPHYYSWIIRPQKIDLLNYQNFLASCNFMTSFPAAAAATILPTSVDQYTEHRLPLFATDFTALLTTLRIGRANQIRRCESTHTAPSCRNREERWAIVSQLRRLSDCLGLGLSQSGLSDQIVLEWSSNNAQSCCILEGLLISRIRC